MFEFDTWRYVRWAASRDVIAGNERHLAKAQSSNLLTPDLVASVQEQLKRIDDLQNDIDNISQRLRAMIREDRQMQVIHQIPGVGELTASALIAAVGDFSSFKSSRQFASWVGLTPRQVGTSGKTQQLGISKRGDSYFRTLLIAGARAVIARSEKSSWIQGLLQRHHCNVVVVALANKIARTVWAQSQILHELPVIALDVPTNVRRAYQMAQCGCIWQPEKVVFGFNLSRRPLDERPPVRCRER